MDKVTIIGTGLIGASLGLAIKQAQPQKVLIVGVDKERSHLDHAEKMGAIDRKESKIRNGVEEASIVILATPVMAIRDLMEHMAPYLAEECLVTDTGSTKVAVLEWASELLPAQVSFVGGHPMAGKESSGPDGADGTLFRDHTYCLIPGKGARAEAVKTMVGLVQSIGARPYFMDTVEHDSFVAAVSHLPLLLSVALVRCTSASPSWEDMAELAASGYRDVTRLASGDPTMHRDMCLTNAELILPWIDAFIKEMYEIRKRVASSEDGSAADLGRMFEEALHRREQWLAGKAGPRSRTQPRSTPLPSFSDSVGEFFLGSRLLDAQRRMIQGWRGKENEEKR